MGCIFCKIINGEFPCHKIYENELVLAFLDINPVSIGHTLIIPKKHYENIFDIPEKELEEINKITKKLAIEYKKIFNADGFTIHQANEKAGGQVVFHYHMHLAPRYIDDGLSLWFHKNTQKKIDLTEVLKKIKEKI